VSFAYEIEANPVKALKASVDVERSLNRITDAAGRVRDGFGKVVDTGAKGLGSVEARAHAAAAAIERVGNTVKVAFGGLALGALIREIGGVTDSYTSMTNRVRQVTTSQGHLNATMDETFRIAQDARAAWDATTESYVRISSATKSLGISQRDALDITGAIAKGLKLGGASAAEAASAQLQLSQAFGAGKLQGDEFRAVAESWPGALDLFAKQMGVTRGELKKLGSEGKITADVIAQTFLKNKKAIDESFSKTIPTITEGMVMMKNAATKFFGEAGHGSGVLRSLSEAMGFVIRHFDTFAKVALGVGQVLLGLMVIRTVVSLFQALTVAVAANPLGAFLFALVTGISLLRQFGDDVTTTIRASSGLVTVGDMLRVVWGELKQLGETVVEFVGTAWAQLTSAFNDGLETSGVELSLENVIMLFVSFVASIKAILKNLGDVFLTVFGGLPVILAKKFDDSFSSVTNGAITVVNKLIETINKLANVGRVASGIGRLPGSIGDSKDLDRVRDQRTGLLEGLEAMQRRRNDITNTKASSPAIASSLATIDDAIAKQQQELRDLMTKQRMLEGKLTSDSEKYGTDGEIRPLSLVDIDRPALAAAAQSAEDLLKETIGHIKADVSTELDSFRTQAAAAADARKASERAKGSISDLKGAKEVSPDEKAAKAYAKMISHLQKELESVTRAASPLEAAEAKLAKAIDVSTRAVKYHVIEWKGMFPSLAQAAQIIGETAQETEKARHPFEAWQAGLRAETDALKLNSFEREKSNAVRKSEEELIDAGLRLTPQLRAQIESDVESNLLAKRWAEALPDLEKLKQSQGKTSWEELKKFRAEITDLNGFVDKTLVSTFRTLEDTMVKAFQGGKIEWETLAKQMEADLIRLASRMLLSGILSTFGPKSVSENDVLRAASLGFVGGGSHDDGGSFMVGGGGGPDSQNVMMRLTPGERVDITPKGGNASSGGGGGTVVVQNIYDRRQLTQNINTRDGKRAIVNAMRSDPRAFRGALGR
jgi:tape measure domain-containing protein